ncbi:precorrin-2 dehydrogenase [Paenibacillus sp. CCS19]|uniref:precorrin-2 dehydrogenase/sirohydrochlorin ferrochelatase family protein n=1 Tax=Paenibacillus sp. CCS19 TaxID=3158387 RepID=UPI00256E30E5|nr:bifunctional precorrin-2 dehydrogenase/sirohydrochlorin ferrochelatase [Paenibacillus cellulosilyticus]GMK38414.1 precorrin-2 dehydrogenase [Paenibacillus cellulosilyticus]
MPEGALYPIMLRLTGKRCVVIGGGKVAERKTAALLEAGADRVEVIAEQVTETLAELGQSGMISIVQRIYDTNDIRQASLVIAATNDSALNARIVREADECGIWVNSASDGDEGTFVTPAVVRRGDLVLGITTSGASPSFASKLKAELEQQYGGEYAFRLQALRLLRERLLDPNYSMNLDTEPTSSRQRLLRSAASDANGWQELAHMLENAKHTEPDLTIAIDRWIDRLSKSDR